MVGQQHLLDVRDMISMLDTVYGKVDEVDNNVGIYIHGSRYPIVSANRFSEYSYHDRTPITLPLVPKTIVKKEDYSVLVYGQEIENGKVYTHPYSSIYSAKVVEEILYAMMYHKSNYQSLYYDDPLGLTAYPLIPYRIHGSTIVESVSNIIESAYSKDPDKLESFMIYFLEASNDPCFNIFCNDIVFTIDSNPQYFILKDNGDAASFRYFLGATENRVSF